MDSLRSLEKLKSMRNKSPATFPPIQIFHFISELNFYDLLSPELFFIPTQIHRCSLDTSPRGCERGWGHRHESDVVLASGWGWE